MSTERKLYTHEQFEARKKKYIEILEAECVEVLTPDRVTTRFVSRILTHVLP